MEWVERERGVRMIIIVVMRWMRIKVWVIRKLYF